MDGPTEERELRLSGLSGRTRKADSIGRFVALNDFECTISLRSNCFNIYVQSAKTLTVCEVNT